MELFDNKKNRGQISQDTVSWVKTVFREITQFNFSLLYFTYTTKMIWKQKFLYVNSIDFWNEFLVLPIKNIIYRFCISGLI
jgi:hypothetical protein